MKPYKFLPILLILALITSACGAEPVPTLTAADVQSTAIAAAFTMVAQTQAAIPTSTPLPPTGTPTETPLPSNTPPPLPTQAGTAVSTVAAANNSNSNATVDPCSNRVLSWSPRGRETIIRIWNTTRAQVTVSLYLNETASHGECGYRSYTLGRNDDVVITDLVQGCYNLWAWSTTNQVNVNASGGGCINNADKFTFEISEGSIKFVGP